MPAYPNAYAKVKKLNSHVEFPGNWFEFGIILNDFLSSTIWAIQIKVWRTQVKNPKIPGIQPKYIKLYEAWKTSIGVTKIQVIRTMGEGSTVMPLT